MWDVAPAESLVEIAMVGIHVAAVLRRIRCDGFNVIEEFRKCVMGQEGKAAAEALFGADETAVIGRISDRRIDPRHIAELRKRPARLRGVAGGPMSSAGTWFRLKSLAVRWWLTLPM